MIATILLSGCAGEDLTASTSTQGVGELDGDWVLTAATLDGSQLELDPEWRVTMTIEGSEVSGRAACNHYFGRAKRDGDAFSVGEIGQTEMACEPPIMKIESAFLEALARLDTATRQGRTAHLAGRGVSLTFDPVLPVPRAALLGVTWVLDTLIQGETTSSTSVGADEATLVINDDGTFGGRTGCRHLSGDYVISGDRVLFTALSADGECSAELQAQDGRVIAVLGDGFTAEINGDRLALVAAGGGGLGYRARR